MAGHKGYGLGLWCEILSGLIPGGHLTWQVGSWMFDPADRPSWHNAGIIVLDVNTIAEPSHYAAQLQRLIGEIHAAPTAQGIDQVLLPGQRVLAGDPNEDPRERLHRSYRTVSKRWHQLDADELLEIWVSTITTSFDPHTSYMSPNTYNNFMIQMKLNLDGIGAQLTSEDGYTKLTSIVPVVPLIKTDDSSQATRLPRLAKAKMARWKM